MVDFQRSARELDLEARTERFVRETIIPYERDPRFLEHGITDALVAEMRDHARGAGLLAPQVPEE